MEWNRADTTTMTMAKGDNENESNNYASSGVFSAGKYRGSRSCPRPDRRHQQRRPYGDELSNSNKHNQIQWIAPVSDKSNKNSFLGLFRGILFMCSACSLPSLHFNTYSHFVFFLLDDGRFTLQFRSIFFPETWPKFAYFSLSPPPAGTPIEKLSFISMQITNYPNILFRFFLFRYFFEDILRFHVDWTYLFCNHFFFTLHFPSIHFIHRFNDSENMLANFIYRNIYTFQFNKIN